MANALQGAQDGLTRLEATNPEVYVPLGESAAPKATRGANGAQPRTSKGGVAPSQFRPTNQNHLFPLNSLYLSRNSMSWRHFSASATKVEVTGMP